MNSAGTRPLSASEIAALTGGRLVGPGTVTVAGIAPLERAGPGDLSFLAAPRYVPYFQRTSASVVLVAPSLESAAGGGGPGGPETRIIVDDPYAALLVVLPVLYPQAVWEAGVHPTAVVGQGATWQEPVAIGPHACLGRGVRVGGRRRGRGRHAALRGCHAVRRHGARQARDRTRRRGARERRLRLHPRQGRRSPPQDSPRGAVPHRGRHRDRRQYVRRPRQRGRHRDRVGHEDRQSRPYRP